MAPCTCHAAMHSSVCLSWVLLQTERGARSVSDFQAGVSSLPRLKNTFWLHCAMHSAPSGYKKQSSTDNSTTTAACCCCCRRTHAGKIATACREYNTLQDCIPFFLTECITIISSRLTQNNLLQNQRVLLLRANVDVLWFNRLCTHLKANHILTGNRGAKPGTAAAVSMHFTIQLREGESETSWWICWKLVLSQNFLKCSASACSDHNAFGSNVSIFTPFFFLDLL